MSRGTVLLGFAEALGAPECAWDLVEAGHDVVAFARRSRPAGLRLSRHVRVIDVTPPEVSMSQATVDVATLVDRLRPVALLPADDVALLISSHDSINSLAIAAATGPAAEVALDKYLQHQLALDVGFSVMPTVALGAKEPVPHDREPFPSVVKGAEAVRVVGDRATRVTPKILMNQQELVSARQDLAGRLLLQPWKQGRGLGVFGIMVDGNPRNISAHRRVRMMNPSGSGSSACVSVAPPRHLLPAITEFLRRSDWDGLFMVELLTDSQGSHWFMEVNGRAWGSMALALARGLTYPRWAVARAALGEEPPSVTFDPPRRFARHIGRDLVHLASTWRGPPQPGLPWPDRWHATRNVARVRRTDRIYNWRPHDPAVFFGDTWAVLCEQYRSWRQ